MKWQQWTFGYTQDLAAHEVQLHMLYTLQQSSNIQQFLVRIGPDTLLTYLTVPYLLVVTFVLL